MTGTVIRAHTLAVNACLDTEWRDLHKLLHECWRQSTDLANWCARELDRRDVTRTPDLKRLPPMPAIPDTRKPADWLGPRTKGGVLRGLYGLAAVAFRTDRGFWAGCAQAVAAVTRDVERKYRRERKAIVWDGDRRPARYRYPFPFPVHASCWSAGYEGGKPVLTVSLPGRKVRLQLRGGPEFGRQLADFRRVAAGEAKRCQLLISRQRASEGCHRRTSAEREPGGGERVSYRVTVKMVVEAPRREAPGGRVLTLCTDPAALWVAELDGRRAWVLNADHVKRAVDWQAGHEARRQRWAQDCKAERRGDPRKRKQFQAGRERCAGKHARRMKSWCQECAAHLTRFAVRQRVGLVAYDDSCKDFLPGFPWHLLGQCLGNALAGEGIELAARPSRGEAEAV